MPAYGTSNPAAIYPGDSVIVFQNENPAAGIMSIPVAVGFKDDNAVSSISVEVQFAAAPGAFEIDVMDADTDVAGAYLAIPNAILNAVNATNFCRFELSPFKAKFAALLIKTKNANGVNIIAAKITR